MSLAEERLKQAQDELRKRRDSQIFQMLQHQRRQRIIRNAELVVRSLEDNAEELPCEQGK